MNDDIPPLNWHSECGTYTVHIKRRVFSNMLCMAEQHSPEEVGTSLVGVYSDDGNEAIVCGLAPLTSDSRGSRFSFVRGVAGLTDFFVHVFRRFRGRRHYVGEWHSHPHAAPIPSLTDDVNQSQIANDNDTECPESILIIIGGDFIKSTQLNVFVYSRTRGRIALIPI